MPRFQTVVRHARFVYSPFTSDEMQGFAQLLADTIRARIPERPEHLRSGGGAAEAPRRQGASGYPDYKAAHGLQPIRDWTWTGHTMRCLKVLTANQKPGGDWLPRRGLCPVEARQLSQLAFWNNQTERMWGVSPGRSRQGDSADLQLPSGGDAAADSKGRAAAQESTFRSFQSFGSTYFGSMRQAGFEQYIDGAQGRRWNLRTSSQQQEHVAARSRGPSPVRW